MIERENLSVEVEGSKKRETPTLTVRVTPGLLSLVDKAVEASDNRYQTRTDLVRDAIEFYSRDVSEGGLKRTKLEPEESNEDDSEHEANVEEALELIKDLSDTDIETIEEFASEANRKDLPKSAWADDRVQTAMRKTLRNEVYPEGVWDGLRKFRKRKSREYAEVLRKGLAIPRSVAKQLVEDPNFSGKDYQEWY
jgi:Arc/MetJ-type ribon-helix-helix transcriptional regulator